MPTLHDRGAWFGVVVSGGGEGGEGGGGEGGGWWFGPQYFSFLFYLNELTISDEMIGRTVTISVHLQPDKPTGVRFHAPSTAFHRPSQSSIAQPSRNRHAKSAGMTQVFTIPGEEVLAHLGYAFNCSRVGGRPDLACWHDLFVPFGGVLAFVGLAATLLAVCVKDPH